MIINCKGWLVPGLIGLLGSVGQANLIASQATTHGLGAFEGHGDVGKVLHAGSVEYDPAKGSYTIAGSGENMWLGADAFHFVWKKIAPDAKRGDITLSADIAFAGTGATLIAKRC